MRGYFTHLAKQSGIAIASDSPARVRQGATPRTQREGAVAPPHVETVELVDLGQSAYSAASKGPSDERSATSPNASDASLPPGLNDRRFSIESEQAARRVAPTDLPGRPITAPSADSDLHRSQAFDTDLHKEVSPHHRRLEQTSQREPDAIRAINKSLDNQSSTRAQASAGEGWISITQEPTPELQAQTELTRMSGPEGHSIPREYVEGIREWFAAPPLNGADQKRSASELGVFKDSEQADQISQPGLFHPDSSAQTDIQEFSLSIGSIRIVVEEPPQQRTQEVAPAAGNVAPAQSSPASGQSQSRDAFALTRNYFRGF